MLDLTQKDLKCCHVFHFLRWEGVGKWKAVLQEKVKAESGS